MITIFLFTFIFYVFTALLMLLAYILWYTLCANVTLIFTLTHRRCKVIAPTLSPLTLTFISAADTNQPLTLLTIPGTPLLSLLSRTGTPSPIIMTTLLLSLLLHQTTRHGHQRYTGTMGGSNGDSMSSGTVCQAMEQGERRFGEHAEQSEGHTHGCLC